MNNMSKHLKDIFAQTFRIELSKDSLFIPSDFLWQIILINNVSSFLKWPSYPTLTDNLLPV